MSRPYEGPRPNYNKAAIGQFDGVKDLAVLDALRQLRQAVENLHKLIPAIPDDDPFITSIPVMSDRVDATGNKLKFFSKRILLQEGKQPQIGPDEHLKTVEVSGGGTTNITTTGSGSMDLHSHSGYSDGGWAGFLSGGK